VQDALKERLMRAYLTEGELIGDPTVLVRLGTEVGLPEDEIRHVVATDVFAAEVREDQRTASLLGIRAVPFFVVDRAIGAAGAQSPAVLTACSSRLGQRRIPRCPRSPPATPAASTAAEPADRARPGAGARSRAHRACDDPSMSRRDLAHVLAALWSLSRAQAAVPVDVVDIDEAIGRGRADMRTPLNLQSLGEDGLVVALADGRWALTPQGIAWIVQDRELSDR
jgi:hypothetical protein